MNQPKPNLTIEYLLLILLALLWGSSYLFIKIAVRDFPPITLTAVRVTIAAIFLLIVLRFKNQQLPRDSKTWKQLLLLAFFNSIGAWAVLAWGQRYIDSGVASVLNSTSPIFVFFITLLLTRHESSNILKLIGALLGATGVALIVGVDALKGLGDQVLGQLAALTGAFLYACSAIYSRQFVSLSPIAIAASTMLWATVILVPLSLFFEQPWRLSYSTSSIAAITMLSIFSSGVALLIYFRLIQTLGSMSVASQAYLRAGFGVVLGVIFLGETITLVVATGIIIAIIGVILINLPTRQ